MVEGSGIRVGIDIGGTFTDLVATGDGVDLALKVPSTPRRPEAGFLAALDALLARVAPERLTGIAHASTIATNALLGQVHLELPRIAFITTSGFRDVLEIGRQHRAAIYDLAVRRPTPLVRREDRLVVRERRTHAGAVLVALDDDDVARVVETIAARDIRSVAIGLLHADVDGAHELAIAAALRARIPDVDVSLSSEIDPQYREYERFSTTVVNAALRPIVRAYLDAIDAGVRARGIAAPVYVMRSDGGMTSLALAALRPATLIESGPAGGAIAAAERGRALGYERVLSFDMGGTTAKAGTICGGTPEIATSFEAAGGTHSGRAVRGSGYPVRFPFVDLAEVSAGGGTLAWCDAADVVRVGPRSAGADPGPACYGVGDEPTVTDANVVLGRLDPVALLGGTFPIDAARARDAVARVAGPLGGDVVATAAGIVRLVDHEMGKVLRIVTIERGHDPRDFTLVAFGGGGPLHACAVARDIGVGRIVVPARPGLFSAIGLLVAAPRAVAVRSVVAPADDATWAVATERFAALEAEAAAELAAQGVPLARRTFARELDLRYVGQSSELTIDAREGLAETLAAFHARHERRYGFAVRDEAIEIVAARVVGSGAAHAAPRATTVANANADVSAPRALRAVFDGTRFVDAPVFARASLGAGHVADGPAIVEQYDATTYVAPGWRSRIDAGGHLVMEPHA